jgi:hypothetical protein
LVYFGAKIQRIIGLKKEIAKKDEAKKRILLFHGNE